MFQCRSIAACCQKIKESNQRNAIKNHDKNKIKEKYNFTIQNSHENMSTWTAHAGMPQWQVGSKKEILQKEQREDKQTYAPLGYKTSKLQYFYIVSSNSIT